MNYTVLPKPTRYQGCFFRSRLEARWAVFFDELGVEWSYETERYSLGIEKSYLPDFWLPNVGRGCFIEVKPRLPTDEEDEKARLLCAGTGQFVMMLCGDPWPKKLTVLEYRKQQHPSEKETDLARLVIKHRDKWLWGRVGISGRDWSSMIDDLEPLDLNPPPMRIPVWKNERRIIHCDRHKAISFGGFLYRDFTCCPECGEPQENEDAQWINLNTCFYGIDRQDHSCNTTMDIEGTSVALRRAFVRARSARFEHGENP